MHLLQQALTDCESSTLISQDFSIVTQRVAPEADGNLLTPGAPCSVPTAHLPLGPGDLWEVWGLGLAPLSWGRAAFRSVPTSLSEPPPPPTPSPTRGYKGLNDAKTEVPSKLSAFMQARVNIQNTPWLARWPLCNKVSFCLSAELLTSGRRGSQEVRRHHTGMFVQVSQTKAQLQVSVATLTQGPGVWSWASCWERGRDHFKLLVRGGGREAALVTWSSLSSLPSHTALISLPLFSGCAPSSK